jgi:uncharacterized membrane protein YphA (DoxX/SURF4 family)
MSELEKLAKQRVPLLYFVPLRWLLGITWIGYFVQFAILTPVPGLLSWAVFALISGILLLLGLFTGLGAFLSLLISYIGWLVFGTSSGIGIFSPNIPTTPLSLVAISIVLLSWKTGRVLGLDKYLVGKAPLLERLQIV